MFSQYLRGLRPGGVTLGHIQDRQLFTTAPVPEAGGDGIINTEDEVRPVLVTDTQYAV